MTDPVETEPEQSLSDTLSLEADENERSIFIFEPIEALVLKRLIPTLHHLDFESDDPITLHISSPGGTTQTMFALADAIQALESPVNLVVYGQLSSAGTVLFAVCAHRVVGRSAEALLHAFSFELEGNYCAHSLKQEIAHLDRCALKWATLMAERGSVEVPWLRRIALGEEDEVVLSPATLVMIGWADMVQEHPIRVPTGPTPDAVPSPLQPPSGEGSASPIT